MNGKILYNPIKVLGKGNGLVAAVLVVIVLTVVAMWAGVHLDGAFDLHLAPKAPSTQLIVLESLIAWLSVGLLLFALSKAFGGNGGAGSHLAAAGLSRFPYILAAIIGSKQLLGKTMEAAVRMGNETITIRPEELISPGLIVGAVVLLGLIIWSIAMLYLGYKESSRLQGGKTAFSFIIAVLVAELVSKLALYGLVKAGI
jgi:hypothetical protein